MTHRNYLVAGLCMLVFQIYAQESLTFKEAVEIGLKNSVTLKQSVNQLEVQEAIRLREKFRYLPDISANARYTQIDGQQFNQVQGIVAFTKSDNISGTLNLTWTVFEGFGRIKSIKQAEHSFDAQHYTVERSKQQLINNIAQQYLQILLSKELLRIAEDNLTVQKTTLDQIKGQVDAGVLAMPDLYTQQAQVDQLEVLRIRSANTLRSNKTTLMQTLQLDPIIEIDPQHPDWDVSEILALEYDLNSLYQTALTSRPDYLQSLSTIEANKMNIGALSAGYYPTLTAFYNYGSNYSNLVARSTFTPTNEYPVIGYVNGDPSQEVLSNEPRMDRISEGVPFNTQFFDNNLASFLGLNLSIPIFDRFQTRTNRVNAKMQYRNSLLDEQNLKRTIYLDVQNAYLNLQAAKADYFASNRQFEAASKAFEVQKERFDLGIGNLVELSQANNTYVQGAASKAQATYTLLFQKILLDFVLGTLKYEDIP